MFKNSVKGDNKLRAMFTKSLSVVTALSFLSLSADSAPTAKLPTLAQYENYKRYVFTQMENQRRSQQSSRQQRLRAKAKAKTPNPSKTPYKHAPIAREDVLLVMPAKGAKADDIKATIEGAEGEICGRLGAGGLGVILVKSKPGKVIQLQRALAADTRDFKHVDFNRKVESMVVPGTEPTMPKAWHLIRMRVTDAWDELYAHGMGFPKGVGLFDTGTEGPEPFVSGWGADCTGSLENDAIDDLGFDFDGVLGTGLFSDSIKDQEDDIIHIGNYLKTMTYGIKDENGHGTWTACTINGSNVNGKGAAGINPQTAIFPIKVATSPSGTPAYADDLSLVKAMCVMYDEANTPVINISYSDMMNAANHSILHEFFKDWYYRKNGLIFVSAGNRGENLSMANQPYVICVSAMAQQDGMHLVNGKKWQSAYGTAVDFTAPGQNIQVCNMDGTSKSASGTSFSAPCVAGVASMIWTINPNLKNTDVEKILRDSCENTDGDNTWNSKFGWGMPDAYKAVIAAEGTRR